MATSCVVVVEEWDQVRFPIATSFTMVADVVVGFRLHMAVITTTWIAAVEDVRSMVRDDLLVGVDSAIKITSMRGVEGLVVLIVVVAAMNMDQETAMGIMAIPIMESEFLFLGINCRGYFNLRKVNCFVIVPNVNV